MPMVRLQSLEGVTFLDTDTVFRVHVPTPGVDNDCDDFTVEEDHVIRVTQQAVGEAEHWSLSFRTHNELVDALRTLNIPMGMSDIVRPRARRNRDA